MFRLDDQWISGYIGVIGGLVAFVIGVSALVLQVALPSYLRTLTRRRHLMRYTVALMIFYVVIAVLLIWIPTGSADGTISPPMTLVIDGAMSLTLMVTILYAIYQLTQINPDSIVHGLMRDCRRDYMRTGAFDPKRKTPHQDMGEIGALETLIDIGAQSSPGFEKQRVLKALDWLASFMFDLPPNAAAYDGRKLKKLIEGYQKVLTAGDMGSQANFEVGAKSLFTLVHELCRDQHSPRENLPDPMESRLDAEPVDAPPEGSPPRLNFAGTTDMEAVMRVCAALGIVAVEHFGEDIAAAFLRAIWAAEGEDLVTFPSASAALREIGVTALKHDKYRIVVEAVNYQFKWHKKPFTLDDDGTSEMLGLCAHVWTANPAGKQQVMKTLNSLAYSTRFEPSLLACIDRALDYHQSDAPHFDTHEMLLLLRDALPADPRG